MYSDATRGINGRIIWRPYMSVNPSAYLLSDTVESIYIKKDS
jgi:hypothetical protein